MGKTPHDEGSISLIIASVYPNCGRRRNRDVTCRARRGRHAYFEDGSPLPLHSNTLQCCHVSQRQPAQVAIISPHPART
ncbi:hypothetical protein J6590_063666 [Homalodisca vitripennis]|nr:hypothetical protein J6590_063666 [Homalodisca vitripennis]